MITISIKRNADGLLRTVTESHAWHEEEFMWTEGNFACDCNRGLLFARAANEGDPDLPCGDSAYSISVVDADGAEVYTEMND